MKQNVDTTNALIRITCGLTMLAIATAKLVRRPASMSTIIFAMIGAMKVGEGITRFCPLTYLYEKKMKENHTMDLEEKITINLTNNKSMQTETKEDSL